MSAAPALELISDPAQAEAALHPMRRRILELLREPDSASGVARRLDVPRQKVNYHVRQLEDRGLVTFVEERRQGNLMERVYRATARRFLITPTALDPHAADPAEMGDQVSSAYLAAVAARTIRDLAVLRPKAKRAGKRLPTLGLEAEVRFASVKQQHAFAEELARSLTALVARYHDEDAPTGRRFRLFCGIYPAVGPSPKLSEEITP